jgi:hypothetical protein
MRSFVRPCAPLLPDSSGVLTYPCYSTVALNSFVALYRTSITFTSCARLASMWSSSSDGITIIPLYIESGAGRALHIPGDERSISALLSSRSTLLQ